MKFSARKALVNHSPLSEENLIPEESLELSSPSEPYSMQEKPAQSKSNPDTLTKEGSAKPKIEEESSELKDERLKEGEGEGEGEEQGEDAKEDGIQGEKKGGSSNALTPRSQSQKALTEDN